MIRELVKAEAAMAFLAVRWDRLRTRRKRQCHGKEDRFAGVLVGVMLFVVVEPVG
jgi:hypothetical protein